jgi:uncharacterized membrane protein YdjX (TVP38/TMEM64 family)
MRRAGPGRLQADGRARRGRTGHDGLIRRGRKLIMGDAGPWHDRALLVAGARRTTMESAMSGTAAAPPPRRLARFLPVLVLAAGLAAFFAFGLHKYVGFEQIKQHRDALKGWVEAWGLAAALVFALGYAAMTAFSIPGGAVATITGGFLFGLWLGTASAVVGATIGAIAVFLAARTAFGDALRRKAGPALRRMEDGFKQDAFSYLLVLRLVPLFPFWLVNLVPALLGVRLGPYAAATAIGIIPGTFVYASVGNGLDALFREGMTPDLGIVFQPSILLPILGLALLALIPVVYKRLKSRRVGAPAGAQPDGPPGAPPAGPPKAPMA